MSRGAGCSSSMLSPPAEATNCRDEFGPYGTRTLNSCEAMACRIGASD